MGRRTALAQPGEDAYLLETRNLLVAGFDVGKLQDQNVLAVLERLEGDPLQGDVVHLEQWALSRTTS